jgi:hypothetical protein
MPMASPPLAPWRCAVFALVALVALAGFTRTPSSDQGNGAATTVASSTGQPADGSASDNVYPDWATAVAPAYTSKVTSKGRTTDQFYDVYQIDTADPYETVVAWYKAHVQTTWPDRRPNQTVGKVGNVVITLQKAESSDGTRTSIGFLKKR